MVMSDLCEFSCPVCGYRSTAELVDAVRDRRKGLSGSWRIVRCQSCQTMSMDPMPTDAELSQYYAAYTKGEQVEVRAGLGSRRPLVRRIYHWLSGDVDPRDFVRIPLDYGSGGATYLSYFDAIGVDIVGAEISDTMIAACDKAGLKVHRVHNFDAIPFDDAGFDVVYLMQVFEHVRSPQSFMAELGRVLRPGGTLYLAVPNAASLWRRVFQSNWVSGWFAPFHLAHYTAESLADLGAQCGLTVANTWSRTPESWFRLNLKAAIYRSDNEIESRRTFVDAPVARVMLMTLLRTFELFVRERDCLVMSFVKS